VTDTQLLCEFRQQTDILYSLLIINIIHNWQRSVSGNDDDAGAVIYSLGALFDTELVDICIDVFVS